MSGTTNNYGFRTLDVDGSDYITPSDITIPVEEIDTALFAVDSRMSAANAAATLTAAANFAVVDQVCYKRSGIGFLVATMKRTVSNLPSTADGNIPDVKCGTVTPTFDPHANIQPYSSAPARSGNRADAFMDVNGDIYITALLPNVPLNINDEFLLSFVYPLKTI